MKKFTQIFILIGVIMFHSSSLILAQSLSNDLTGKASNKSSKETYLNLKQKKLINNNTRDAIITNQSEILFSPYKPTYQYTNNKGALIYDNGPVFNSTGTGAGGANESIMQSTSLGMSTYGFGFQLSGSTRNRVAEDFSVNATSWTIDSIIFFGYQTGSPTSPSTFTEVNLRIWDGVPDAPGSNVIWGDTTTNVLTNSYWSGVYRVQEGSSGGNTRPIMKLVCSTTGLSLPAGTYWVDYQAAGSGSSGPWAPPIVITGQANTGNAIQRSSYVWAPIVDVAPQGLPFLIYGTCIGGFTDDIGVTSITAPTSSATLTNAENISVVITNFASNAQTGFPISYSINGQIPVTETFTGTLAPLSSTNFTFSTTADFSNPGQIYTIKAYTDLLNDQYQANDTSKSIIQNLFGVICSANATNCDEFIDSLMFSNISNLGSGCGLLNGYSDFTTDTAQVNIGSSYILDVYNPTPYAKDIVGAWFDWNQDGNFNGPGEFYTVPTLDGGHYFSTNITIPNWALNGPTRMRVRIQWQGTLDPCGNTNYGEVEDYTVNVMGSGIACDVETSSIDMNSNMALGTITPQATFKNLGYAAQTFNVTMNISGGYTSTKTINSLSPGATQQISFDPWTPSSIGNYNVEVYTTLPCDVNNSNDTLNMNINIINIDIMYVYVAYDPTSALPEGPGTSTLQIPQIITSLAATSSTDFICGGTWAENKWYAAEYNANGNGNLYTIDTITGTMTAIGTMGKKINGISYDPVNHIMYGITSTELYTINMNTGAATLVGNCGISGSTFIGLACNMQGQLYTYSLHDSKLYSINPTNGTATVIGNIGFTAAYAQDLEFDMKSGVLYMAAYNGDVASGELRTVNTSTGATTLVGPFMNNAEICGLAIPYAPISSINEINENINFNFYPNPANSIIYVNANYNITSIKIYNPLGQIVAEYKTNSNLTKLDVSNIVTGLYFIQAETEKGLQTQRLIINK